MTSEVKPRQRFLVAYEPTTWRITPDDGQVW
jgi:hypothetical protein